MKVNYFLAQYLINLGARAVFGVSGANIEDIYDALLKIDQKTKDSNHPGIQAILAKHEFSAGAMADAYSRITGSIGIVLSTSGGGAFNLIPALAESFSSQVPVLALIGQAPTSTEGKGGFQDSSGLAGSINAETIFQGVSKYCKRITSPDEIPQALEEAVALALLDPKGPVILLIPKNIQQSEIKNEVYSTKQVVEQSQPPSDEIIKAISVIQESKKILIICGNGVCRTKSENHIEILAKILDADVALTADGKSGFNNYSPQYVGIVGAMGHSSVLTQLELADTCIIVGTRLPDLHRVGLDSILIRKKIVYIHSAAPFTPLNTDFIILKGSTYSILKTLVETLIKEKPKKLTTSLNQEVIHYSKMLFSSELYTHSREFLKTLETMIEPDSNILVDAGNIGASVVHFLKIPKTSTFNIALGMGGMGYSFGAGIGAVLANKKKTYVISGDGSFFMHGSEVHTAVELNLPITFIIFNNNAHGMCVTREQIYLRADYPLNRFKKSHLATGLAATYPSLLSFEVNHPNELEDCLYKNRNSTSTLFISIELSPDEFPPFHPFLQQLDRLTKNSEVTPRILSNEVK